MNLYIPNFPKVLLRFKSKLRNLNKILSHIINWLILYLKIYGHIFNTFLMRRGLIGLVTIFLLLISSQTLNAASIKTGGSCTKLGQAQVVSGFKYTCIKSGKKLVWSNGVKIPITTPSPTSTSKSSAASENYPSDLTPVHLQAFIDFLRLYQNSKSNSTPNVQWIVEPSMNIALEKQIKDDINVAAKFFANQRPVNIPLKIWIAMTPQFKWIYDQLTSQLSSQALDGEWLNNKLARSKVEPNFLGGGAPGATKDGVDSLFFNGSSFSNYGNAFWSQVTAHEYTHVVQRYAAGSMAPMLCWVREGNANYYGWLLAGRNSQAAYRNFWLQALSEIPRGGEIPDYESKPASYWSNFFLKGESLSLNQCDPWINYIMGAMAFQYLGGTYGNDAITNFYLGLKDGWMGVCDSPLNSAGLPCESWKIVFKKSFGISPSEAYPKIGEYIVGEIKWAHDKKILWNDDALKIAPIPTD